jgi:hypothetical protein
MSERRALQIIVAIASLIPISAGAAGVVLGPGLVDVTGVPIAADSHFRYLSGLLLGVGLAFVITIPRIEAQKARFRALAAIVMIRGLARLLSLLLLGYPDRPMALALVMELVVTPSLALWQARVADKQGRSLIPP